MIMYKLKRVIVERNDAPNKRNPNSIRLIIAIIIGIYFDGNVTNAANMLSKFGNEYRPTKDGGKPKTLTFSALRDILCDDAHIEYWHLECISHYLGMPTGALLLLSRLMSDFDKNSSTECELMAKKTQQAISEMLANMHKKSEPVDIVKNFIKTFSS